MISFEIVQVFVVVSFLIILQACDHVSSNERKDEVRSYLIDLTDENKLSFPQIDEVQDGYEFLDDYYKGASFRLGTISSAEFNETKTLQIEREPAVLSNEISRVAKINDFFVGIEELLSTVHQQNNGYDYSIITPVIIAELKILSDLPERKKTLKIYSDLRELRSDGSLNLYQTKMIKLLFDSPDKFKEILFKGQEIPDLSGIEIEFFYDGVGMSYESIQVYEAMAKLYKKEFQSSGAIVSISAYY